MSPAIYTYPLVVLLSLVHISILVCQVLVQQYNRFPRVRPPDISLMHTINTRPPNLLLLYYRPINRLSIEYVRWRVWNQGPPTDHGRYICIAIDSILVMAGCCLYRRTMVHTLRYCCGQYIFRYYVKYEVCLQVRVALLIGLFVACLLPC